jgi:hypothetical protein
MTRLVRSIWRAQMKELMSRGAVKRGPRLLAGLLLRGKCRRKIHVAYSGSHGQVPDMIVVERWLIMESVGVSRSGGIVSMKRSSERCFACLVLAPLVADPSDRCVTK